MQIKSKSNKHSIIMSKKEWQTIGLKSGWINKSSQYEDMLNEDIDVDTDKHFIVEVTYNLNSDGEADCPNAFIIDGDTKTFTLPYDKYFQIYLNRTIDKIRDEIISMSSNGEDNLELHYIDSDDVYKLKDYTKITHTEFFRYPNYDCKITLMFEYTIPNTPPN